MHYFGTWISESQRQPKPLRTQEELLPLLPPPTNLNGMPASPVIGAITRNNSLRPICRAGQTSRYWTSALLIIPWVTFLPSAASRHRISPPAEMSYSPHFNFLSLRRMCAGPPTPGRRVPIHMYAVKFGYVLWFICLVSTCWLDWQEEPRR